MRALLIAAVAALALSPVAALANANPDWADRIKRIASAVSIERDGALRPAKVSDRLAKDHVFVTGSGSGAGLTFRDNSRVFVGPTAKLAIAKFVFEPGKTDDFAEMRTDLNKGLAAFVSGRVTKGKPGATQVRRPSAILGVRGTTFVALTDVGPLDK
jgi:hypothetical protein